jgi:signal transduction histidine kinase
MIYLLNELNFNLFLALYAIFSSIIFWSVSLKRKKLIIWAIAFTFFAIGSSYIYLQAFNPEFRLLGNIYFAISILCLLISVFYDYYNLFFKKERNRLLFSLFLISLPLLIIFFPYLSINIRIQLLVMILLVIGILAFFRIYKVNQTPTCVLMLLTMISAAFTMLSKIWFTLYELQEIWDLGYISNTIFITFILLTGLMSFFEDRLIKSEKNYHNMYDQMELYKDIFTHDINNILQNIQSGADLIRLSLMSHLDKAIEEMIDKIGDQVLRGKELGININELSEILNKETKIIKIEIISIIRNVINTLKDAYEKDLLEITFNTKENEYYVLADKKIVYIFYNIMSNSIRHNLNNMKHIELIVSKETIDKNHYIKIQIIDNGFGIPNEYKKIILKPHNKNTRYTRRGLGLLLVRKIINNYDGKIQIENKTIGDHTQGSNFIILLNEAGTS